METQEKIISTFEELQTTIYDLKNQIVEFELLFNQACNRHIDSNFQKEWLLDRISSRHDMITLRHDAMLLIRETVSAFRDFDGYFLDVKQLLQSIELLMLNHAEEEEYEIAAIIKKWHDKFVQAVYFVGDLTY
ncbi:MAG: hypothetical protein LBJ04_08080 [Sphingobacterium sp.]|uniref:hypothetical protein n=1 Tax=Sphingobacterium sp. TaxID=341027 RepID=UPI00281C57BA|nr:hypothetical protein [Sphingobacterium sp.]MDR0263172.1 hypothetical protein [Sphingobacterium sp.]